jgi:hypothetical protein
MTPTPPPTDDPVIRALSARGCMRYVDDPDDLFALLSSGIMWNSVLSVAMKAYAIEQIVSGAVVETPLIISRYPAGLAEHIAELRAAR